MNCPKCGKEIQGTGKFCTNCGAKIEPESTANVETKTEQVAETVEETTVETVPDTKKKKVWLIASISASVVLILGVILFLLLGMPRTISDEKAEEMIEEVLDELESLDYESAQNILEGIRLKEDSEYLDVFSELEEIVKVGPRLKSVDTSDYPNVTIEIGTDDKKHEYKKDDFHIDGENLSVSEFKKDGKRYVVTYTETEEDGGVNVDRKIVFDKYKEVDFKIPFSFESVEVTEATLNFVTSNVESYPEISLYLRVVDEYGEPIENLTKKSFTVREYLNIDDYLERDVIYAAKVDGQDALNVSLAIDRSGSIDDVDMDKIKNATNTFLSKLQFDSGDKAEIISFDTNVMQMCLFTNNKDNLMNGVNSMYPYGTTACYDAIVRSIQNASVQNGARCVIVFTDGLDNESVNTVDSVINLAVAKSVPVYTIGVGGSLDESALRRIANSTGGTYHHIDDISSMSQIYDEIYREQKNMYHVKYVSGTELTEDAERRVIVTVSGKGYKGYCDKTYTPVIPVTAAQHTSRYEVIKEDITWEEANRVCIDKGGHLATITSREEEEKIIAVAEKSGVERLWIGGYTTNNQYGEAVGHWVMGEPFVYQNWYSEDEPSRFDSDNEAEFYLMLWKIKGRWSWNDQRNDLINSPFASTYKGKMGYVIEYED